MTESAALRILDYLELTQEGIREVKSLVDKNQIASSMEKLDELDRVVLKVMTELSFQDLTGQQIKRVIQSLKKVEDIVFDVYVTPEILKKSKELSP